MSKGSKKSRQRLRNGSAAKESSYGDIPEERRMAIVKAIARGVKSKKQLANEFNVKIGAIKRINQVYLEEIKNLKAQFQHAEEVPVVAVPEADEIVVFQEEEQLKMETENAVEPQEVEQPVGAAPTSAAPELPQDPPHSNIKLKKKDVLDIYRMLQKDRSKTNQLELAELYNVSPNTIHQIVYQAAAYEWLKDYGPKLVGDSANKHLFAKILEDDDVRDIYQRIQDGESVTELADHYGVSKKTIHMIRYGDGRFAEILGLDSASRTSIQPKGFGNTKLSPEDVINIYQKLQGGAMVVRCAEEYGVSPGTINWIKYPKGRYKIIIDKFKSGEIQLVQGEVVDPTNRPNPPKKEKPSVEVKSSVVEFNDSLLIVPTDSALIPVEDLDRKAREMHAMNIVEQRIPATFYVPIGMCAGRHPMPCKEFVFSNISNNLIGDYARMYEIAYRRIKEVLDANANITLPKGIKLYVTGLAPALISIVKACTALGVNLLLMHHNPKTDGYESQDFTIYGKFNPCGVEMLPLAEEIYSYGCTIDFFCKIRYGFEVLEIAAGSNGSTRKSLTLILDRNEAYKYFKALTTIRSGSRINLNSVAIGEDGVYYRKDTILKNS